MKNLTTYTFLIISLILFSCNDSNSEMQENAPETAESEIEDALSPLEIGQNIANQTQLVLGKNLMKAINSKGTEYAVSFCSTKAIHLTDSSGLSLNAKVKRVSDKNRNPDNIANWDELNYMQAAKRDLAEGKTPKPIIHDNGSDKLYGFYPIVTNQMCMQCHGEPKTEITPATLSKLNTLYPKDKATGYKPNELRGIWVVEMDK